MVATDSPASKAPPERDEPVLGDLIDEGTHTSTWHATLPPDGRAAIVIGLKPIYRTNEALRRALERQGQRLATIDHPGLPTLLGPVRVSGGAGLALVDHHGHRLSELFEGDRPVEPTAALAIAVGVTGPLAAIHRSGAAHGRLRPEVIELSDGGAVYLHDFGWCTPAERGSDEEGLMMPEHMAPEQLLGEQASPASDVFQLGMLLYRMVAGRAAFDPATGRISQSIRHSAPPPISRHAPTAPARLDQVVARCLQKRPRDRYPDVASMATALLRLLRAQSSEPLEVLVSRAVEAAGLGKALPAPAEGGARRRPGVVARWLLRFAAPLGLAALALATATGLAVALRDRPTAGGADARGVVKRPARLRVLATPWAEVYVDGRLAAVTPVAQPIELSPGSHRVLFKHPNATTEERSIEIIAGQTVLLEVHMKVTRPPDAGRADAAPGDESP